MDMEMPRPSSFDDIFTQVFSLRNMPRDVAMALIEVRPYIFEYDGQSKKDGNRPEITLSINQPFRDLISGIKKIAEGKICSNAELVALDKASEIIEKQAISYVTSGGIKLGANRAMLTLGAKEVPASSQDKEDKYIEMIDEVILFYSACAKALTLFDSPESGRGSRPSPG
jgi:hypothetical protein